MHDKPVSESEGVFGGDWEPVGCVCGACGSRDQVYCRVWESSCGGYEDVKYQCRGCGMEWWVDGPDA